MSTATSTAKPKMDEMTKTMLFVGVALGTFLLALFLRPAPVGIEPDEQVGKPLFTEFTDPLEAKGLEVTTFDEELGRLSDFKVVQTENVWTIPSHQNYPADAENRLEEAATMFVDLNVINVVSEADGAHAVYGVVEPDKEKTALGDEGVGTLVNVLGENNKKLVELIIGKEVTGVTGQHYARLPGKSRVYQLQIDPSKLSTKFQDWIETDLLQLSSFDIENITLKDYSVELGIDRAGRPVIANYDQRIALTCHEDGGEWVLDDLQENRAGELQPAALLDGEVLNKERLNTLRDSLGELKIVDVERKPDGLGGDLKADKGFLNDTEGMQSLVQRGFYPVPIDDNTMDLWSSDGEILINTKDGVRYVLRFGQVAGMGEMSEEGETSGLNRFLFVTTNVNEEQFPLPEKPAGMTEDVEAPSEETADADAEDADNSDAGPESGGDEEPDDDESDEEPDDDDEAARLKKEYQRKLNDRNDKIKEARDKVDALTYRFADWYYIIPDDVFKKVRLRRNDVIEISEEAKKAGSGLDAFRNLIEEGVEKKETTPASPPPMAPGGFGAPPGIGSP